VIADNLVIRGGQGHGGEGKEVGGVAMASSPVAINKSNFYIDTSFGGVK
jgi:hypothetical protein